MINGILINTIAVKAVIFFVSVLTCWSIIQASGKDYPYFITENEGGFTEGTNGERFIAPKTIEKAKHTEECQPSAAYPEGNWGRTNAGLQISVRFEKSEFTNNEPVVAIFIVRNVSDRWLAVSKHTGYASDFIIYGPDGRRLVRRDFPPANTPEGKSYRQLDNDLRPDSVSAGMQYKLKIDLRQFYDFRLPGKYTVSLKLRGYIAFPKPETEDVVSGKATITIRNTH